MDQLALHDGTKLSGKWPYSEDTAFVVEKNTAYPVAQIDDHVKHIFREHKQEADHLANVGAEEPIGKGDNTELEGCSRVLGWQHKDGWKKHVRCCDQKCGPGQVDHNH